MKYTIQTLIFLAALSSSAPAQAAMPNDGNAVAKADTLPFTYKSFMAQEELKVIKGQANANNLALNVYRKGDNVYLEIPRKALGKDIFALAMSYRGSSYLSPVSGLLRIKEGADKHSLYLTYNRSLDTQADSTHAKAEYAAMTEALQGSNMEPIDMSLEVVSMGEGGKSYIVDISSSVNTAQGIFDVSKNTSLNHPDLSRSSLVSVKPICGGVAFDLYRSQTDMVNRTMDTQEEQATTTSLKFVLQLLPERKNKLKPDNPFYGFNTITRQEYDTKTYVSRRRQYVSRWNFNEGPITVYINPITPKPYRESIVKAFDEWLPALNAAGVKKPFVFTSDDSEAMMSYRHIYVDWFGATTPDNKVVTDALTGEILAARVNVCDWGTEDLLMNYYVRCRNIDKRIAKDTRSIGVRQDIIQALMAGQAGEVLGLKRNDNGYYQFSPQQLRSRQWLKDNGTTSSVTGTLTFNYILQPSDGIGAEGLLPKVSLYDRAAIAYLYGKSNAAPQNGAGFFYQYDMSNYMTSWKNPKAYLSCDLVEAARLGIEQVKRLYKSIDNDMKQLPDDQNSMEQEHSVILSTLGHYQQLLTNVASIVGDKKTFAVRRGVNESPNAYPSRVQQTKALDFLDKEILHGVPAWSNDKTLGRISGGNVSSMMRAVAVAVYKALLDEAKINNLVSAEDELGDKAFNAKDLFSFIDRNLMCDYDANAAVPEYVRLIQANVLPDLADNVFKADVSTAIGNEGATMLHAYFVNLANKVEQLSKNNVDKATRDNYEFIMMRFKRNYFDKQH